MTPGWPRLRAARHGSALHKQARWYYVGIYRRGVHCCAIGGEILWQHPGKLDLAHSDDGLSYLGLACRRCNRGPAKGQPGGNPWGGRRRGRAGGKRTKRKVSPSMPSEREAERMRKIIERDNARRRRVILPSTVSDDGRDRG